MEGDDELGPCTVCDHGWRTVGEAYVDDHVQLPEHVLVTLSDEDRALLTSARRAALTGTVYPCKVCRPRTFFRWVRGCWDKGHDRAACDSCRREDEAAPVRRRARAR